MNVSCKEPNYYSEVRRAELAVFIISKSVDECNAMQLTRGRVPVLLKQVLLVLIICSANNSLPIYITCPKAVSCIAPGDYK